MPSFPRVSSPDLLPSIFLSRFFSLLAQTHCNQTAHKMRPLICHNPNKTCVCCTNQRVSNRGSVFQVFNKYDLFIPFFRCLRHPRVSLLMAVCLDPHPEHLCLVMEHFEFASLNHLLYKTQIEMNLPERIHCLLDVAEGMTFLHNHSIIHGFLNSFSVFIYEAFRAKIGNLEFSQENGEQKQENACSVHESWMAPEQLLHEPPNMAGDAYRLVLAAFS